MWGLKRSTTTTTTTTKMESSSSMYQPVSDVSGDEESESISACAARASLSLCVSSAAELHEDDEHEDEESDEDSDDEDLLVEASKALPRHQGRKKGKKPRGRKSTWTLEEIEDLVDVVCTSEYFRNRIIFTNQSQKNKKNSNLPF